MENIVTSEQMESLKALTETNLKVSEAKNLLFKLQEEETEYLIEREKKVMDRIQKVVDESTLSVQEANKNYGQIKELNIEISAFVQNLLKINEDFKLLRTSFDERNVEWERDISRQQDDLAEIRKEQSVIKNQLEIESKNIEIAKKKLKEDQIKLDSDRGAVERSIKRLKENRV